MSTKPESLAERLFRTWREWDGTQDAVVDVLWGVGLDGKFDDISHDDYDTSLELLMCSNDLRLTPEQQRAIWGMGFDLCWVNHYDGWETFYSKRATEAGKTEGVRKFREDKAPKSEAQS